MEEIIECEYCKGKGIRNVYQCKGCDKICIYKPSDIDIPCYIQNPYGIIWDDIPCKGCGGKGYIHWIDLLFRGR